MSEYPGSSNKNAIKWLSVEQVLRMWVLLHCILWFIFDSLNYISLQGVSKTCGTKWGGFVHTLLCNFLLQGTAALTEDMFCLNFFLRVPFQPWILSSQQHSFNARALFNGLRNKLLGPSLVIHFRVTDQPGRFSLTRGALPPFNHYFSHFQSRYQAQ